MHRRELQQSIPAGLTSALLAAAVLISSALPLGCGDDDGPSKPAEGDGYVDVPEDIPTIIEALEGASEGDKIRIAPGTYPMMQTVTLISLPSDVELIGRPSIEGERPVLDFGQDTTMIGITVESRVKDFTLRGLRITGNVTIGVRLRGENLLMADCQVDSASQHCVSVDTASDGIRIEGNILLRPRRFGVRAAYGAHPEVVGNTIVHSRDCGIYSFDALPYCERNIVYDSVNYGFYCAGDTLPTLVCNNVYMNGIDYSGSCPDRPTDLSEDPVFCEMTHYSIASSSPCAPEMSPCGELIGGVGVGCEN